MLGEKIEFYDLETCFFGIAIEKLDLQIWKP